MGCSRSGLAAGCVSKKVGSQVHGGGRRQKRTTEATRREIPMRAMVEDAGANEREPGDEWMRRGLQVRLSVV